MLYGLDLVFNQNNQNNENNLQLHRPSCVRCESSYHSRQNCPHDCVLCLGPHTTKDHFCLICDGCHLETKCPLKCIICQGLHQTFEHRCEICSLTGIYSHIWSNCPVRCTLCLGNHTTYLHKKLMVTRPDFFHLLCLKNGGNDI